MRFLNQRFLVWMAASASLLVALGPGLTRGASGAAVRGRVVATFAPGTFPESLAIDRRGRKYVSVTTWGATEKDPGSGQIVRVTSAGKKVPFGPVFRVGFGLLTGVAIAPRGALYVAVASSQAPQRPGVWRISKTGKGSRVLTLSEASFPNGIALSRGAVFVSDSAKGVIWKAGAGGKAIAWSKSKLLAPASKNGLGANGVAFRNGALYVAVSDRGTVVRIPFRNNGSSGRAAVIAHAKALVGADGIVFDRRGNMYIATSRSNTLLRLAASGRLRRIAGPSDGLLYPTAPAIDNSGARSKLYVLNGDFYAKGTPTLMRVPADFPPPR